MAINLDTILGFPFPLINNSSATYTTSVTNSTYVQMLQMRDKLQQAPNPYPPSLYDRAYKEYKKLTKSKPIEKHASLDWLDKRVDEICTKGKL